MSDAGDVGDPYAQWKGWDPAEFARFSAYDSRYFGWHVQRALGSRAAPIEALEVGFGNGRFMGWLRAQGHHAVGVETNTRLVEVARSAGFQAELAVADVKASLRFDLVVAFDVLEHVPPAQTQAFVAQLAARLLPGGRLLLRFPNGESPFGLWMQHGDTTHVNAFGLSKMRQLCAECGLHLLHSGETLPWQQQPASRRFGALMRGWQRRAFETRLRKMYLLPRGLDLSPNQLVVLSRATERAAAAS